MSASPGFAPSYRRRILAVGLVAAGALYSFGAPVYVRRIENDLERRVPAELADAGFSGVTAEFDGQDGTLSCDRPLSDPQRATEAAYDVRGVRAIELDRSCRVNVADEQSAGDTEQSAAPAAPTEHVTLDRPLAAGAAASATITQVVARDARLSYLSLLLAESGLAQQLGEQATLFAPTDEAFERLSADALALLRSDTDLLLGLLSHHVTSGQILAGDLESGPVTLVDGTSVEVMVAGDAIRIAGASVEDADLLASNGVVHVIDRVMVPKGVELPGPDRTMPAKEERS